MFSAAFAEMSRMFRREPWWAEFWSGIVAVAWAALSYVNAADLSTWPSMRVLTSLGDERFWNLVAFGLGLAQIVFLLLDERWLRWCAALALCWFWGVLTVGVWQAVPWAPFAALYAGWCGINIFSILRLLRPNRVLAVHERPGE